MQVTTRHENPFINPALAVILERGRLRYRGEPYLHLDDIVTRLCVLAELPTDATAALGVDAVDVTDPLVAA